jgi:sec-independent protein translocase protein TatA
MAAEVLVFTPLRAYFRREAYDGPRVRLPGRREGRPGEQVGTAGLWRGFVAAEENPMGSFSIWHWIVVVMLFLLLFGGRGKISELMGDFATGIKSFKKGMQEDDTARSEPVTRDAKTIDHQPAAAAADVKRRSEAETKLEGSAS